MKRMLRQSAVVWIFLILTFWYVLTYFKNKPVEIPYSDLIAAIQTDEVLAVNINDQQANATLKTKGEVTVVLPGEQTILNALLAKHNTKVKYIAPSNGNSIWSTLFLIGLPLILFFVFLRSMKKMQGGGGITSFTKSLAQQFSSATVVEKFSDVAGIDEAVDELKTVVDFLKNPYEYTKLGGRLSKGVLLVGPPGTGKTLLARAVAGEANVPFFYVSGSDFVEMFVGVGASRVRDLFAQAKRQSPSIIFIDEIDAIGSKQSNQQFVISRESDQTLNQLLVEMDGFQSQKTSVIVMGATNKADVLDEALLRSGRFDMTVTIPRPDRRGREQILKVHAKRFTLDPQVNLEIIAQRTFQCTGADLANLLNRAALIATQKKKNMIEMDDVLNARDWVMYGQPRTSHKMAEQEKERVAYHEAGHALVAVATAGADPLYKITIIPHGQALGFTAQEPDEEQNIQSKHQLEIKLAILLGGRAAEKYIFKEISTGAANDIEQATNLARAMVTTLGMSEKIGPVKMTDHNKQFTTNSPQLSEKTINLIDEEIKIIISDALNRAEEIIMKNDKFLRQLTARLMAKETVDGKEVVELFKQTQSLY